MTSFQEQHFPAFINGAEFPTHSISSYNDTNGNNIFRELQRNALYLSRTMSPHFIHKIKVGKMKLYINFI